MMNADSAQSGVISAGLVALGVPARGPILLDGWKSGGFAISLIPRSICVESAVTITDQCH